jgi:hypothetical protein
VHTTVEQLKTHEYFPDFPWVFLAFDGSQQRPKVEPHGSHGHAGSENHRLGMVST